MGDPSNDEHTKETMIHATQETIILTNRAEGEAKTPEKDPLKTQLAPSLQDDAKYEIIRGLGKGGFAWVYLVRNRDLDRYEAMKILNSELTEDEDVINRFVKEAKISANFNHQNIVTIFEVQKRGRWTNFKAEEKLRHRHREPFAYFTMTFVEGETSTNLIKNQGRVTQKQAISIVMDTCKALSYAHGLGVIHRDIKPENILVDQKGSGIVMDFGIAKVMDQTRQTAAGTFMGTARYVSPEQAMGREIDCRSDLYSLGITLYELVTGKVPFDSDQWMTVLYQHINEPPPPPEKAFSGIDRELRTIILKMLEKKPENRYQTAEHIHDVLNLIYQKLGGDDRSTQHLDQIVTRRDLLKDEGTIATRLITPEETGGRATEPPVRTKVLEESSEPVQAQPAKSPKLLVIGLLAAVLAAAAFFVFFKADKPVDPDPGGGVVVLPRGRLLVSAFPRGEILRISNEAGENLPIEDPQLPQILDLPEGSYQLIISYDGLTQEKKGYVSADLPLSRINAEFRVENDRFLMGDL